LQRRVLDGGQHLDPPLEVARQKVGAPDHEPLMAGRLERQDPAVLEEGPEHASHPQMVAQAGDAGAQRADAAHHDVDLDAGGRGGV